MSIKLKYTAILACSVVLAMPAVSSAQWLFGSKVEAKQEENKEVKQEEKQTPSEVSKDDKFELTNEQISSLTVQVDGTPSTFAGRYDKPSEVTNNLENVNLENVNLDEKLDQIFNDSVGRISIQKDQTLEAMDAKFAVEMSKKTQNTEILGNVQAKLDAKSDKYIGEVTNQLSSVSAHLKAKVNALDAKIKEDNALAINANERAINKATSYTKDVEAKSTEFFTKVKGFEITDITGDNTVDGAIYQAFNGQGDFNTTKSDNENLISDTIKQFITFGAPKLQISSK